MEMAILLLFQPGHKLKSKKYFLFEGQNTIGYSKTNTITIDDLSLLKNKAKIIINQQRLVTIQDISQQNAPQFLYKQCTLPPIQKIKLKRGKVYELCQQKDFWIGNWRGMFKGDTRNNLRKIRNVSNWNLVDPLETDVDQTQIFKENNESFNLKATLIINEQTTLKINQYQNTMILDNGIEQRTLVINQEGKIEQEKSLQHLSPTLIDQQLQETLIEKELDPTLIDKQNLQQNLVFVNKTFLTQGQKLSIRAIQKIVKQEIEKDGNKYKEIHSFDGLFGQENKKEKNIIIQSNNIKDKQKINQQDSNQKQIKNHPQNKIKKKIAISGFKVNLKHKDQMQKLNLQLIENPYQQFDILLIKELKISLKLCRALVNDKLIFLQSYLFNKISKPVGKIQGWIWQQILRRSYENKMKNSIFKEEFFFIPNMQFQKEMSLLIEEMGGIIKKKIVTVQPISVILKKNDKIVFDKNAHRKNCTFFSPNYVIQSALLSERIVQKHKIDHFYFQE